MSIVQWNIINSRELVSPRKIAIIISEVCKKILYCCTSAHSPLNYCLEIEIFFKSISYLYEVVRTNFVADFWTFRNFWPQFRENCGGCHMRRICELSSASERAIHYEKRWKLRRNRAINGSAMLVRTMHPRTHGDPDSERDRQKKT